MTPGAIIAEPSHLTLTGDEYGRVMAKAGEHGEPVELIAAGRPVEISSPDKVMFPEPGITKLDIARYYLAVEESIMRTVRNRRRCCSASRTG